MVGDSNNEANFQREILLTNRQVLSLSKVFSNGLSANIRFSKTQLSETGKSGGFLGRILQPLLKTGLLVMKNVLKPLAKFFLLSIELTAAATDASSSSN